MSASIRFLAILSLICIAFIPSCISLGSTDTLTWGGSNDRTGYEENHNMDPAIVSSQQFGLLFRTPLPAKNFAGGPEQIFASPLVYTAADGIQYLYVATTMNNIYKIHAKNGTIAASRNVGRPFLQTDLGTCTDISPVIGVTATGVIDPATGTWYFSSKTYADQDPNGPTGRPNGRYYIHGVSTEDLSEKPNFPVDIENTVARNNPLRSFTAGIHHQRPGLLQFKDYIYVGFASHCIQYNYTGWIMGFQKDAGQVVEAYAMEGAGVGPTVSGAGIWMSGGGLASNGVDSIYWSTGNGQASQLDQSPVNGRNPPTSLEEAAVHAIVKPDGTIAPIDFFMPWEKVQLDGADKDLGTSPLQLLPSQFSCGNVQRIGMVTGKSGKTYWLNMDDMGGYRNGPNRLDNIIQVYQHENSVYAGAGVYPLEGGYVYVNVINFPTRVFQFTCQGGTPYFNPISKTTETNAGRLSVGHGTVTSLGKPGTGLLWVSDMDGSNLRVYDPVPDSNGHMKMLNSFATPGVTKFSKLSFGDGTVYQITSSGYLYAYGSPVNLPMECETVQFPPTNLNSSSASQTVHCRAKTDLSITAASSPQNFRVQLPILPIKISQGANFTLEATFSPTVVGSLSSSLFLNTTQAASGYTSTTQIQLRGTSQSVNPILAINPPAVTWNGVITGESVNQTVVLSNLGNGNMTITSIKYSLISESGPWITPNVTNSAATSIGPFTFFNMPASIASNSAYTVPINFNPTLSGGYAVYIRVESNGGSGVFDTFATGAEYPKAVLEFEGLNGAWTKYDNSTPFTFGNVFAGDSRYLRLRLTNAGGPNAAPIAITVSKPPFGIAGHILGASNGLDLGEGQLINAGQSKTANMFCAPPKSQVNQLSYSSSTTWTMNLNDPTFGHQLIPFACNVVTPQVGPMLSNGTTQYAYAGCYKEFNPGRQLQKQLYTSANNTNDMCISQCAAAGYVFAGTQFRQECWCGNNRPLSISDDANCYFECSGDASEVCGGNGIDRAGTYISLFGDKTRWDGNTTTAAGPFTNPGVKGFTSIGCWTDTMAQRTLTVRKTANDTVASCLQTCQGYQYAGVEFGGECYCDNSLVGSATLAPVIDCSQTCNNNYTEFCGGASRLNVYQFGLNATTTSSSAVLSTTSSISPSTSSQSSNSTTSTSSTSALATISDVAVSTIANSSTAAYITSSQALSISSSSNFSQPLTTSTSSFSIVSQTPVANASSSTLQTTSTSTFPSSSYTASSTSASSSLSSSLPSSSTVLSTSSSSFSVYSSSSSIVTSVNTTATTSSTTTQRNASVATSSSSLIPSTSSTFSSLSASSGASVSSSSSSSSTPQFSPTTLVGSSAQSSSSTTSSTPSTTLKTTTMSTKSTASPTIVRNAPGFTYSNCYTEAVNVRGLSATSLVAQDMTVEKCASFCSGYSYMAVEYGSECYCGNKINTAQGAVPASDGRCKVPCAGDTSQICGGGFGLTLYSAGLPLVGCAIDTAARTLNGAQTRASDMTVEKCLDFCGTSFPLAGLEYGTECYCGGPVVTVGATGCTSTCGGNAAEQCGGSWRLSVYNSTAYLPAQAKSQVGGYTYQGCYLDGTSRVLNGYVTAGAGTTQEACVATCKSKGYKVAGVEYGKECWCGSTIPPTRTAEGECDMKCAGDSTELCGAGMRLNVWAA